MNSTVAGMVTEFKLLQPLNAAFLMICSLSGKFKTFILPQFSNALSPIIVKPLEILIEVKFLQLRKA